MELKLIIIIALTLAIFTAVLVSKKRKKSQTPSVYENKPFEQNVHEETELVNTELAPEHIPSPDVVKDIVEKVQETEIKKTKSVKNTQKKKSTTPTPKTTKPHTKKKNA